MKKLIPFLLITFTTLMLSSCIILLPEDLDSNKYTLTCHNESDTRIVDWCVVKNNQRTYARKNMHTEIRGNGGQSSMYLLSEGSYVLYVAFVEPESVNDYVRTKTIKLNKDYDVYIDQTFVDEYYTNRR